jgi:hypothetical protein
MTPAPRTAASGGRSRRRLSRTFSRARWGEYGRLLGAARDHGYTILALEDWVENDPDVADPSLILRHDVDQHPASALRMARIEEEMGVRSTWYFRWRTAHPAVIARLRRGGFSVGLHYETLTRRLLAEGGHLTSEEASLAQSRAILRDEIAAFKRLFGTIRSVTPHGDSRLPSVSNADLLRGESCADYGIRFDGNEAMAGRGLAYWLTDRSRVEGGWKDGVAPERLFVRRLSPILCLTHPNNWASGAGLWLDRVLRAALPRTGVGRATRPVRTGSDDPPL